MPSNDALRAGGAFFDLGINLRLFKNELRKAEVEAKKSGLKISQALAGGPMTGGRGKRTFDFAVRVRQGIAELEASRVAANKRANAVIAQQETATRRRMIAGYKADWAAALAQNRQLFRQRGGMAGLGIPGGAPDTTIYSAHRKGAIREILPVGFQRELAATATAYFGIYQAIHLIGQEFRDSVTLALRLQASATALSSFLGGTHQSSALVSDMLRSSGFLLQSPESLTTAAALLARYGVVSQDVAKHTKSLAALSLGSADELQKLALAFAQVSSAGRLQGEEMRQLKNTAFNPLKEIAAITGETMLEVRKRMEAGAVSFDEVAAALTVATGEGSKFFKTLEDAQKKQFGQLARLQAEWKQIKASVGDDFLEILVQAANAGLFFGKVLASLIEKWARLLALFQKTPGGMLLSALYGTAAPGAGSAGLPNAADVRKAKQTIQDRFRNPQAEADAAREAFLPKLHAQRPLVAQESIARRAGIEADATRSQLRKQLALIDLDIRERASEAAIRGEMNRQLWRSFQEERKFRKDAAIDKHEQDRRDRRREELQRRRNEEDRRKQEQFEFGRRFRKAQVGIEDDIRREEIEAIKNEGRQKKELLKLEKEIMLRNFRDEFGAVPKDIREQVDRLFRLRVNALADDKQGPLASAFSSPSGVFDARFARQIFGGGTSLQNKMLKETEKIRRNTDRIGGGIPVI